MSFASRTVLEASAVAARRGDASVLALVLETEGSTYVRAGAIALFGGDAGQVGWLSGGCLEPGIAARAAEADAQRRIEWMEVDTREDEDLLAGSALGCRGRLRIALLPLAALPGWDAMIADWMGLPSAMILTLGDDGRVHAQVGDARREWRITVAPCPFKPDSGEWDLPFAPLSRVAVFGAGPEAPLLLPLLRTLGWKTLLVERRARWQAAAALADVVLSQPPAVALAHAEIAAAKAALVMHHHFEFDREALEALGGSAIPFVGLLGPGRRREDLFKLLPASTVDALQPRLHSPVGLKLGGQGAEAIALSIAAQLQAWRHGE